MPHTLLYAAFFGLIAYVFTSFWTTNKNVRFKALMAGVFLGIITGLVLYSMTPNTPNHAELPFLTRP